MSTMNGNPHIYPGPQIADPDTINEGFIGEEGITAETIILSELTRNTEATLALAYEQRTANLMQFLVDQEGDEARKLWTQVEARLGLSGDAS